MLNINFSPAADPNLYSVAYSQPHAIIECICGLRNSKHTVRPEHDE